VIKIAVWYIPETPYFDFDPDPAYAVEVFSGDRICEVSQTQVTRMERTRKLVGYKHMGLQNELRELYYRG
jgi:hypothetical protein